MEKENFAVNTKKNNKVAKLWFQIQHVFFPTEDNVIPSEPLIKPIYSQVAPLKFRVTVAILHKHSKTHIRQKTHSFMWLHFENMTPLLHKVIKHLRTRLVPPILQQWRYYRKTSIISRTLIGNKIVDNSDVVGASPVGAAPTTSSFST